MPSVQVNYRNPGYPFPLRRGARVRYISKSPEIKEEELLSVLRSSGVL